MDTHFVSGIGYGWAENLHHFCIYFTDRRFNFTDIPRRGVLACPTLEWEYESDNCISHKTFSQSFLESKLRLVSEVNMFSKCYASFFIVVFTLQWLL